MAGSAPGVEGERGAGHGARNPTPVSATARPPQLLIPIVPCDRCAAAEARSTPHVPLSQSIGAPSTSRHGSEGFGLISVRHAARCRFLRGLLCTWKFNALSFIPLHNTQTKAGFVRPFPGEKCLPAEFFLTVPTNHSKNLSQDRRTDTQALDSFFHGTRDALLDTTHEASSRSGTTDRDAASAS